MKAAKPPAGEYASEKVGDNCFFVFQDRKQVYFITNAFPEHMDSKVFRMQPGGVLCAQSVPPSDSSGRPSQLSLPSDSSDRPSQLSPVPTRYPERGSFQLV